MEDKKKLKRVIKGKTYYYSLEDYKKIEKDLSDQKERTCLKCNLVFLSENKFNRICKECNQINKTYHYLEDGEH